MIFQLIFSKMDKNLVLIKIKHILLRLFMTKRTYLILICLPNTSLEKARSRLYRIKKFSKITDKTPLLTNCYPIPQDFFYFFLSKKYLVMGSALSPSLLVWEPK